MNSSNKIGVEEELQTILRDLKQQKDQFQPLSEFRYQIYFDEEERRDISILNSRISDIIGSITTKLDAAKNLPSEEQAKAYAELNIEAALLLKNFYLTFHAFFSKVISRVNDIKAFLDLDSILTEKKAAPLLETLENLLDEYIKNKGIELDKINQFTTKLKQYYPEPEHQEIIANVSAGLKKRKETEPSVTLSAPALSPKEEEEKENEEIPLLRKETKPKKEKEETAEEDKILIKEKEEKPFVIEVKKEVKEKETLSAEAKEETLQNKLEVLKKVLEKLLKEKSPNPTPIENAIVQIKDMIELISDQPDLNRAAALQPKTDALLRALNDIHYGIKDVTHVIGSRQLVHDDPATKQVFAALEKYPGLHFPKRHNLDLVDKLYAQLDEIDSPERKLAITNLYPFVRALADPEQEVPSNVHAKFSALVAALDTSSLKTLMNARFALESIRTQLPILGFFPNTPAPLTQPIIDKLIPLKKAVSNEPFTLAEHDISDFIDSLNKAQEPQDIKNRWESLVKRIDALQKASSKDFTNEMDAVKEAIESLVAPMELKLSPPLPASGAAPTGNIELVPILAASMRAQQIRDILLQGGPNASSLSNPEKELVMENQRHLGERLSGPWTRNKRYRLDSFIEKANRYQALLLQDIFHDLSKAQQLQQIKTDLENMYLQLKLFELSSRADNKTEEEKLAKCKECLNTIEETYALFPITLIQKIEKQQELGFSGLESEKVSANNPEELEEKIKAVVKRLMGGPATSPANLKNGSNVNIKTTEHFTGVTETTARVVLHNSDLGLVSVQKIEHGIYTSQIYTKDLGLNRQRQGWYRLPAKEDLEEMREVVDTFLKSNPKVTIEYDIETGRQRFKGPFMVLSGSGLREEQVEAIVLYCKALNYPVANDTKYHKIQPDNISQSKLNAYKKKMDELLGPEKLSLASSKELESLAEQTHPHKPN